MRILVTGGAGNVGQEVTELLCLDRHEPVVYDLIPSPNADVRSEIGDINDSERLAKVFDEVKPEAVIHLASMLQFACESDPAGAVKTNVAGTVAVLEAARQAGTGRFVFASSVAVYGSSASELNESSPVQPDVSVYGATKLLGERLLRRYRMLYGMTCRTVRLSAVLSSRPVASEGIAAVVAKLFSVVSGQDAAVTGVAASELRHYVHIKDAALAIVLAATKEKCEDDLFVVAGPPDSYVTFAELVNLIRSRCKGAGDVTFSGKSGNRGRIDWRRAAVQLGYQPRYNMERMVREAVESCLNRR